MPLQFQGLPYQVSILDAETHLCALCLFKHRFATEAKQREEVTCRGCDILQSSEKVKWILSCFKRLEVFIDWHDALLYKSPVVVSDATCIQYL